MSTASSGDLEPLQKLLSAVGLPWARFRASGALIESHLSDNLEQAVTAFATGGVVAGSHEVDVQEHSVSMEVVVESSGEFLVYLAPDGLRNEGRVQRAKVMESLAGKVVHHYNNILTEFYGHVSLLGRMYAAEEEITSKLDRAVDTINRSRHLVERYMFMLREVREPKDTVNIVDVLQDVKTILDPILSPRITFELGHAVTKPVRVSLEHQLLMQMMVNVVVAAVNNELLVSQLDVEIENNDADVVVTFTGDRQCQQLPDETAAVCRFVAKVLMAHGGDMSVGDDQGIPAFRFSLSKVIQRDSDVTSVGQARSEKAIILLVDPVLSRSDASKTALEDIGYSVLDISEAQVANEVFQAQPNIFERVFIESSLRDVADEMQLVANPGSVKLLGNDWPSSRADWLKLISS